MTLKHYLPKDNSRLILAAILLIAFVLRCWRLTFQSYWLDELHTMNEADPDISWTELFNYLKCCDQHPPLHFFIARLCFTIFGHTEFVGRFISVIFGTAGVWAMYLLGKEVYDKRLGLIAATLTCFNYFHIFYSQEARNYILAFFFAALSFVFFIRIIKYLKKKDVVWYAVFALLMMYSHYYGLFMAAAQFFAALIFIVINRENGKKIFARFLLAGGIVVIGYLPWLPFLLAMTKINSFWIGQIRQDFFIEYFNQYFGESPIVLFFVKTLLIYYLVEVLRPDNPSDQAFPHTPVNSLQLTFILFFTTTFLTYLIPYVRSVLVVPMLFNRYTIVVVPAILIAISIALLRINNLLLRNLCLAVIIFVSLLDLVVVKHYYTAVRKTQFREVTSYITSSQGKSDPVINEVTNWQHRYYLKHYQYKGAVLAGKKEDIIDSILKKSSSKYDLSAFWIVGFHGDKKLADDKKAALDTAYTRKNSMDGFDSWAEFYVSKRAPGSIQTITSNDFSASDVTEINGEKIIALSGGKVSSKPVPLQKGNYQMTIISRGTPLNDTFPHLKIYLNQQMVSEFYTGQTFGQHKATLNVPATGNYEIKVEMDNDAFDRAKAQDRNTFIQRLTFSKL